MIQFRRVCALVAAMLVLSLAAVFAKTIEFDAATIADINAAFDAGTLTSEALTRMCLARIAAFDRTGPALHAVITLNPKALEQARALDVERKAKGRRSPLHGIPVVLKDNYDTFDMPTTGGSVLLEGSIPVRVVEDGSRRDTVHRLVEPDFEHYLVIIKGFGPKVIGYHYPRPLYTERPVVWLYLLSFHGYPLAGMISPTFVAFIPSLILSVVVLKDELLRPVVGPVLEVGLWRDS